LTNSSIRLHASSREAETFGFLLFFGGYAALIAWFKYFDVYHTNFSTTGAVILLHNLFRLLFIFYLFWMIQAVGAALLRIVGARDPAALETLDYLALTFFAGTGAWHIVLLAIGYANLLNTPVMILLTAPVVALAFRELRLVTPGVRAMVRRRIDEADNLFKTAAVLLCLVWGMLLMVKGLYPGNGHEYYAPYLHSYESILQHGGLWPHEFWWFHFYVQGAGLFFLAMLLTDPLAPQLVTLCFLSAGGLATFLFVRRLAPNSLWPMISVLLLFGSFIYTPGWGDFRKLHEFNTSLVIAILWMTVVALGDNANLRRAWLAAVVSAMTAAIVLGNYIGVFLGAVFGILAVSYLLMGERRRGLVCISLSALAVVLVATTLAINHVVTGLISGWDPSLPYLWRFADLEKLRQWNALPVVLLAYQRVIDDAIAHAAAWSFSFLLRSLRLELLWPLFVGGLLVAAISAYQRWRSGRLGTLSVPDTALILIAALAVYVVLAAMVGRAQLPSFYRFASFMTPIVIVAGIALWTLPLRARATDAMTTLVGARAAIAVLAACAVMIAVKTRFDRNVAGLGAHALAYAAGFASIDAASARPSSGGLSVPSGGIYPGARGAYAIVGPGTPIWSVNAYTYCLLPDCKMMSSFTVLMPGWDRLMWGTPEEGHQALQAAGLNYFLISRELPVTDPLLLSPLFSPDNIARYLGVRWTDGTTTLLTWPGPDTKPPDEAWLADYRRLLAAQALNLQQRYSIANMKTAFERLNAMPHPWRPCDLPRTRMR
jgi:hypothetical protein